MPPMHKVVPIRANPKWAYTIDAKAILLETSHQQLNS